MTSTEIKHLSYEKLLSWIKDNLSRESARPVKRESVANELTVSNSIISRGLLMLTQHGYLVKVPGDTRKPSGYKITGDITSVTPAALEQWVSEYNTQSAERSATKRLQEEAPAPLFTSAYRTETKQGTAVSLAFATGCDSTEPADALSPAQKLLKQAQALLEEENRIKAEQAEQRAKQALQPDSLALIEARINAAELKVNTIFGVFSQAYQALQEISPAETEPVAEEVGPPTTRMLLVRLVNSFAAADRKTEHETWKFLYGQYDMRHGFNVYAHASTKGERNYLGIFEKHGHIDNLYVMAKKLFVLPELK